MDYELSTVKYISPMTSATSSQGTVTTSSLYSGNMWDAFDGNNSTSLRLEGNTNTWINYEFIDPVALSGVFVHFDNLNTAWHHKDIEVIASNDGSNWTTLYTNTLPQSTSNTVSHILKFSNKNLNKYKHYRYVVKNLYSSIITATYYFEINYFKPIPFNKTLFRRSDGKIISSTENQLTIISGNINEYDYVKYGMDSIQPISFKGVYEQMRLIEKQNNFMGTGKIFEHNINLGEYYINKIELGHRIYEMISLTSEIQGSSFSDDNKVTGSSSDLAFDGDYYSENRGWQSRYLGAGAYLGYDFYVPVLVEKYKIYPYVYNNQTGLNRTPRSWTFEGWSGTTWVVLDERSNITWEYKTPQEFNVSVTNVYSRYRINISENNGDTWGTSIAELEMYGYM